jgi:hypothetical protein
MEIKMKQNKICRRCNGRIDEKKERYTHVEDWVKGKIVGESWWHLDCFKKAMNRELTQLEKTAAMMLNKAGTLYSNLPEEFKEETIRI